MTPPPLILNAGPSRSGTGDDPELMAHNLSFLLDMVRFSQPLDSVTAGPEPELVAADWDDEAFREYLHDLGPDDEWAP